MSEELKYEAIGEEPIEKTLIQAYGLSNRNAGAPVEVNFNHDTFDIDTKSDLIKIAYAQNKMADEWGKIYLQSPDDRRELSPTDKKLECGARPAEDIINTVQRAIALSSRTGGAAVEVKHNETRFIVDEKSDAGKIADSLRIISQERHQIWLEGPSGRSLEAARLADEAAAVSKSRSPLSQLTNVFNKAIKGIKVLAKGRHHKTAAKNNFHS